MTPLDASASQRVEALIDIFRRAEGRMAALPVHNPLLAVEGRGFRPFDDLLVGVLVTPWCMNLVLLPGGGTTWPRLPQGSEVEHVLPCGTVRFVTARDDEAGDYRMCSLFSPMGEFADMAAARATADAALEQVLASPAPPPAPQPEVLSRRDLFRGRSR